MFFLFLYRKDRNKNKNKNGKKKKTSGKPVKDIFRIIFDISEIKEAASKGETVKCLSERHRLEVLYGKFKSIMYFLN